jgi:uncharacterized membrane protein YeiH
LAGIVNEIFIYGRHFAGPFPEVLDLLGTFVFARSGAAAGVKSKLDLFGLTVPAFATGNAGGTTRDLLIGASFRLQLSATGGTWEFASWPV